MLIGKIKPLHTHNCPGREVFNSEPRGLVRIFTPFTVPDPSGAVCSHFTKPKGEEQAADFATTWQTSQES